MDNNLSKSAAEIGNETSDEDMSTYLMMTQISNWYVKIVVIVSLISNLFWFVSIMIKKKPKLIWHYLAAIAASDTAFLLSLVSLTIKVNFPWAFSSSDWFCRITSFVSYTSTATSAWLWVMLALRRMLAVTKPFLECDQRVGQRYAVVMIIIFIAIALFHSWSLHMFVDLSPESIGCDVIGPEAETVVTGILFTDTLISYFIPFLIVSILNIYLYHKNRQRESKRKHIVLDRALSSSTLLQFTGVISAIGIGDNDEKSTSSHINSQSARMRSLLCMTHSTSSSQISTGVVKKVSRKLTHTHSGSSNASTSTNHLKQAGIFALMDLSMNIPNQIHRLLITFHVLRPSISVAMLELITYAIAYSQYLCNNFYFSAMIYNRWFVCKKPSLNFNVCDRLKRNRNSRFRNGNNCCNGGGVLLQENLITNNNNNHNKSHQTATDV